MMELMETNTPEPEHGNRDTATFRVFYDASCPLCAREIGFYQEIASSEPIQWVDVSSSMENELPNGLTREAALARFHVELANGQVVDGARAFAELWTAVPKLRKLGLVLRRPPFVWGLELGYTAFLKMRPKLQRCFADSPCLKPAR